MTEAVKKPEPEVARKQLPEPKGWKILVKFAIIKQFSNYLIILIEYQIKGR